MRRLLAAALVPVALVLTACSPTVALEPADDAANPACAEVSVRLPEAIGELVSRETNAQATGAWGEPTAVILRCGVPAPAPTAELPCITVEGVDWLRDDSDDPNFVFTTYGREPAVEVIINGEEASGLEVLTALGDAVSRLPSVGACIVPEG